MKRMIVRWLMPEIRQQLVPSRHGTAKGYQADGCRCDECRKAATAERTHYRHLANERRRKALT